jgi:hypothetical protein
MSWLAALLLACPALAVDIKKALGNAQDANRLWIDTAKAIRRSNSRAQGRSLDLRMMRAEQSTALRNRG